MNATLGSGIPCGDNHPAVGQHILAELAIEDQLIAARLGHLRRGGQLVKKEDALADSGEKLGWRPLRLIRRNARQAAQIHWIELQGAYIEKVVVEIAGDLSNDLRFPNTASAPDVKGYTFADQRVERLARGAISM